MERRQPAGGVGSEIRMQKRGRVRMDGGDADDLLELGDEKAQLRLDPARPQLERVAVGRADVNLCL